MHRCTRAHHGLFRIAILILLSATFQTDKMHLVAGQTASTGETGGHAPYESTGGQTSSSTALSNSTTASTASAMFPSSTAPSDGSSSASTETLNSSTGSNSSSTTTPDSSTGASPPSSDPFILFMSWRGNDVSDCGFSTLKPCATLMQSMAQLYANATHVVGPVVLLVEELPLGQPGLPQSYPCENSPEGVYVALTFTIDTYSLADDGSLQFRQDTALRIGGNEMARLREEHGRRFPSSISSASPSTQRPTTRSDLPLAHSDQRVIFDCLGHGRAMYIYGNCIVRINNIAFTHGNASATWELEGGAILIAGGGLLMTNCSLTNNTALFTEAQAMNHDAPTGGGLYAASASFVYLENLYATGNRAESGAAVLIDQYDLSLPLDTFLTCFVWIRESYFQGNQAAQGGAIYILTDPPAEANPTAGPNDFDAREAKGMIWTIERSVFVEHTMTNGNEVSDGWVGRNAPTMYLFTWSIRCSALRIVSCTFTSNGALPSVVANSPLLDRAGGAFALLSTGSWVDSSILIEDSEFVENTAGFGGAVAMQLNAQVNISLTVRSNIFVGNTASRLFHQSAAGALQVQLGPRLDFGTMPCNMNGCILGEEFGSRPSSLLFRDNIWQSNHAEAGGGALSLFVTWQYSMPTRQLFLPAVYVLPSIDHLPGNVTLDQFHPDIISIRSDSFLNNTSLPTASAQAGAGGSVIVNVAGDFMIPLKYEDTLTEDVRWQAYVPTVIVEMESLRFIGNTASCDACSGGALFQRNGLVRIRNTTFDSNSAHGFGGAIALDRDSSAIELDSCTFTGNQAALRGQVLHVLGVGAVSMRATVMLFDSSAFPSASQIEIPLGGNFSSTIGSLMRCPAGYSLTNTTISSFRASSTTQFLGQLVSSRSMACVPCPPNTFSFAYGSSVDDAEDVSKSQLQCQPCPFGGDCSEGSANVRAIQNSWGVMHTADISTDDNTTTQNAITFYRCPDGLCCPFGAKCAYNYCASFRSGPLCSDCLPSTSPTLGSPLCRRDDDCHDGQWFWPTVTLAAGGFSAYLLLAPKARASGSDGSSFAAGPTTHKLPWASMLKVLIYFLQQASVLQSASSSGGTLAVSFRWITSLLNFRVAQFDAGVQQGEDGSDRTLADGDTSNGSGPNRGICLTPRMSSASILAVNFLLPTLVACWFVLIILLHRALTICVPTYRMWMRLKLASIFNANGIKDDAMSEKDDVRGTKPDNQASIAEIELNQIASTGVGPDDASARATLGSIHSSDDSSAAMSTSENVDACPRHPSALSCILAAASIEFLLFTYASFLQTTATLLQCVELDGKLRLFQAASVECYQPFQVALFFLFAVLSAVPILLWQLPWLTNWCTRAPTAACPRLLGAVRARYRVNVRSYWESILLLRRYLFVLFFTFIQDEFVRIYLLLLLVLVSTFLHLLAHPFAQVEVNALESISLFCLAAIAAIQIRAAAFATSQTIEKGTTLRRSQELNGVELFFLLLPVGSMLVLIVAFFLKRRRSSPLEPSTVPTQRKTITTFDQAEI